jgi:hypothetical protein
LRGLVLSTRQRLIVSPADVNACVRISSRNVPKIGTRATVLSRNGLCFACARLFPLEDPSLAAKALRMVWGPTFPQIVVMGPMSSTAHCVHILSEWLSPLNRSECVLFNTGISFRLECYGTMFSHLVFARVIVRSDYLHAHGS